MQVYDGVLSEPGVYEQAEVEGREAEMGVSFRAVWKSLDEFGAEGSTLYPTGLLELLSKSS